MTRKPGDLPAARDPLASSGVRTEKDFGMSTETTTRRASADAASVSSSRVVAIALAALLGTMLVAGTGFAHTEAVHNAAHDTRHSLAFPCH